MRSIKIFFFFFCSTYNCFRSEEAIIFRKDLPSISRYCSWSVRWFEAFSKRGQCPVQETDVAADTRAGTGNGPFYFFFRSHCWVWTRGSGQTSTENHFHRNLFSYREWAPCEANKSNPFPAAKELCREWIITEERWFNNITTYDAQ